MKRQRAKKAKKARVDFFGRSFGRTHGALVYILALRQHEFVYACVQDTGGRVEFVQFSAVLAVVHKSVRDDGRAVASQYVEVLGGQYRDQFPAEHMYRVLSFQKNTVL